MCQMVKIHNFNVWQLINLLGLMGIHSNIYENFFEHLQGFLKRLQNKWNFLKIIILIDFAMKVALQGQNIQKKSQDLLSK